MMKPTIKKHLWEVEHPYHCNEENYYKNGLGDSFECWDDFYSEYGDSDKNYNLIFRWDWDDQNSKENTEHRKTGIAMESDELRIYWIQQRTGVFQCSIIKLKKEDEPKVIRFLKPRLNHLMKLWRPL